MYGLNIHVIKYIGSKKEVEYFLMRWILSYLCNSYLVGKKALRGKKE